MSTASGIVPNQASAAVSNRVIAACFLLFFAAAAAWSAVHRNPVEGIDEIAHASYVASLQEEAKAWHSLERLHMLDPKTFRFTDEPNYLNHAPLYYGLLALTGPRLEGHPQALVTHRLINTIIAVLGLAAALSIGVLAGFGRYEFYAYSILLCAIPVLVPLAGAVNNDNAAIAGGMLTTAGLYRLMATGRTGGLWLALAGLIVTAFAKLTGLILVGALVTAVLAHLWWRGRFAREWWLPVLFAFAVCAAPYAWLVLQYGSPAPNTPGQIHHIATGAALHGWDQAERLSPAAYLAHFFHLLLLDVRAFPGGGSFWLAASFPVIFFLCALGGLWFSVRRWFAAKETAIDVIVICGWAAMAMMLIVHLWFSYSRHVETGWLLDAYIRYYLPLGAVLPQACLSLLSSIQWPRAQALLLGFLIAGPLLFRML